MLAIRPISCGPVRAPLSLHDTASPHPMFYVSPQPFGSLPRPAFPRFSVWGLPGKNFANPANRSASRSRKCSVIGTTDQGGQMATTSQQNDFDRVKRWGKEFLTAGETDTGGTGRDRRRSDATAGTQ